jgi:hypothetical protein
MTDDRVRRWEVRIRKSEFRLRNEKAGDTRMRTNNTKQKTNNWRKNSHPAKYLNLRKNFNSSLIKCVISTIYPLYFRLPNSDFRLHRDLFSVF